MSPLISRMRSSSMTKAETSPGTGQHTSSKPIDINRTQSMKDHNSGSPGPAQRPRTINLGGKHPPSKHKSHQTPASTLDSPKTPRVTHIGLDSVRMVKDAVLSRIRTYSEKSVNVPSEYSLDDDNTGNSIGSSYGSVHQTPSQGSGQIEGKVDALEGLSMCDTMSAFSCQSLTNIPESLRRQLSMRSGNAEILKQIHQNDTITKASYTSGIDVVPELEADAFENQAYLDSIASQASSKPLLRKLNSMVDKPGVDQSTLDDPNNWTQSLPDLENSAYVDSIQSTSSGKALLARTGVALSLDGISRWIPPVNVITRETYVRQDSTLPEKQRYLKNLVVISCSQMFIYTAFSSLRNLQSSINHEGGLGLTSLACLYACFFMGCIFATAIVQRLMPKTTIILTVVANIIYSCANFYPSYYTLLPASCILGFFLANMWTASGSYILTIATSYASLSGKSLPNVLTRFNGIFFLFFQNSQIIGGLIASTVMGNNKAITDEYILVGSGNSTNNTGFYGNSSRVHGDDLQLMNPKNLCGSKYCHDKAIDTARVAMAPHTLYMLLGIYIGCGLLALFLTAVFLDRLSDIFTRTDTTIKQQIGAVFKFFGRKKALLLMPMMFYTLLQFSFFYGEVTKAFVTCPLGVHMVGYFMTVFASMASISAYISGKLSRYTGRLPMFALAALVHVCLMVLMLLWQPRSGSMAMIFMIAAIWGSVEGIWQTQLQSFLGLLFARQKESAFAGCKMMQSLASTISFMYAPYTCTATKIYIVLAILALAMALYCVLELHLRAEKRAENEKDTVEQKKAALV
ncbi:unnamed protein product [Owenia fusiformis]|uniref:UNC93-like protein n=1 Tax=Owenia fusiformis TaxID=6347 RepID=A0A8S4NBA0_OWEFU|nr:unnamed protein product [Owenia fusiformis]